MTVPTLSKTRFISGHQCELRLWNDCFRRELAEPVSAALQAILDQGTAVGELAQQRYPGGTLVAADFRQPKLAVADTQRLMADPGVPAIYEAGFLHQGVLVRVDVLVRLPSGGWELVEVKSSTQCKPVFALDAQLQYWVLRGCGVQVDSVGVLTLNPEYRFDGRHLDLDHLFKWHPQTLQAAAAMADLEAEVLRQQAMLAASEPPVILPGPQCNAPYDCPYFAACTRHWPHPEFPVTELPRLGARVWNLRARGLWSIPQLPREEPLTPLQARVRTAVVQGHPWIGPGLPQALNAFQAPIHYLDFETIAPAVPRFQGKGPSQPVPVQWSCHRVNACGDLLHGEFLAPDATDPRAAFARTLLEFLGQEGSICIYSQYEVAIIRSLARDLPDLAAPLLALLGRMVDLLAIIRDHLYSPAFHGSYSIKKVLPALVNGRGYEGLEVADGMAAIQAFEAMTWASGAERARLRQSLLEYCGQDTLAMLEVHRALVSLTQAGQA